MMHARNLGCETWMVGYDPSDPEHSVVSTRSLHKVEQWSAVGFNHRGWERMDGYTRIALPLDIGLCPLLVNDFTLGKSDIKAIEYSIAGAAPVVWNNPVYSAWVHGETCLKVGPRRRRSTPSSGLCATRTFAAGSWRQRSSTCARSADSSNYRTSGEQRSTDEKAPRPDSDAGPRRRAQRGARLDSAGVHARRPGHREAASPDHRGRRTQDRGRVRVRRVRRGLRHRAGPREQGIVDCVTGLVIAATTTIGGLTSNTNGCLVNLVYV
jgi:hypothetical protein